MPSQADVECLLALSSSREKKKTVLLSAHRVGFVQVASIGSYGAASLLG